jgi:HAD superfamily hydrolase (TIGR01490 family)
MNGRRAAAFFDVDETLITVKSMFEFLRFWLARNGDDGAAYASALADLQAMAARGVDRVRINRAYYRGYAGARHSELLVAGREWFGEFAGRPEPYHLAALDALAAHRAEGDTVVLVSGSFLPCLEPVAEAVGADLVLCSTPVVAADGLLTGEVRRSMIGAAKADAVVTTTASLGCRAEDCHAYGDHASDLDMLLLVGHPVVVGADPVLTAHAERHGWPVLPAHRGRAPGTPDTAEQPVPFPAA